MNSLGGGRSHPPYEDSCCPLEANADGGFEDGHMLNTTSSTPPAENLYTQEYIPVAALPGSRFDASRFPGLAWDGPKVAPAYYQISNTHTKKY